MNKLRRMNSLFVATTMFVFFMVLVTFGCKKKIQDTVWINKLDLGGIELENTMTCLADGTFAVKTSTVFLGLPISITAAEGVYSGDLSEDGEASFTVEKIAQETGFSDAKSFCRVFKKLMGKNAGEYRKRIREEA